VSETDVPYVETGTWLPIWDGASYAGNTAHHRAFDADFLGPVPLRSGDRVLDLGCGAGDLTRTIADLVTGGHVVGLDAQPSMLDEARRRAGANQSFVAGPVQELDRLVEAASFDVVVSRAVLHWVPRADQPAVARGVARALRPGGWYRVDAGGFGNIARTQAVLDEISAGLGGPVAPWCYAGAHDQVDWLEAAGLTVSGGRVRLVAQRRPFDEATLLGWLRSQVYIAYEVGRDAEWAAAFRAAVEARLDDLRRADGTFDQTYVRVDVLVQKPA
jgi:ubiquinone/menaquinone biosynthesis C-methylase UbiE